MLSQIFSSLNRFLPLEQAQVHAGNVVLARETDVVFDGATRRVSQADLVLPEQFPGPLTPLFAGGPSWINASVIPLASPAEGPRFLVTFAAGKGIGSPQPSINLSHELDKTATVTDEIELRIAKRNKEKHRWR